MVEKRGMGATHVKICVGNNNGMINGAINIRVVPLLLLLLVPWGWVPGGWYLGVGTWNGVGTLVVVGTRTAGRVPWGWRLE